MTVLEIRQRECLPRGKAYSDHSINIESEHALPQIISSPRLFDMGFTLAEGTKLECFRLTSNDIFVIL